MIFIGITGTILFGIITGDGTGTETDGVLALGGIIGGDIIVFTTLIGAGIMDFITELLITITQEIFGDTTLIDTETTDLYLKISQKETTLTTTTTKQKSTQKATLIVLHKKNLLTDEVVQVVTTDQQQPTEVLALIADLAIIALAHQDQVVPKGLVLIVTEDNIIDYEKNNTNNITYSCNTLL